MRKLFLFLCISICLISNAQTPIPIYSPNFSSSGGWQINGNASIISGTYLRLTPNAGAQAGSAFWKQKVSLPTDFSFSTYFISRMTPGSRADGMTFCIQQASNSAGSSGGGLGYQGIPGRSIAIEYDIYDNGEIGGNNHIALDINGVLHGTTNVVASPVNLADGTNKHNWIEYNGATRVLEVRISNTTTRPTAATLTVTNLNLAANFLNNTDVFFGFTAATGGATAEHAVYSAAVNDTATPLSPAGSYSQGIASVAVTSSNNFSCSASSTTLTVTTRDINGIGQPTAVNVSFDLGGGVLSQSLITTNASGIGTLTYTLNSSTLASNTIRVKEPNVGAYGTTVVTISGTIPVGGSVSSTSHTSNTNTGTLTLTGHSGTISKWQRSIDGGINWSDIVNTSNTQTYINQQGGTMYRSVITSGTCTVYSQPGTITIQFTYSGFIYNSENIGISGIPVKLYYKLKTQTMYILHGTYLTDSLGKYNIVTLLSTSANDFRISLGGLNIIPPLSSDAYDFNQKLLTRSFNSRDYYRMDVNNDNNLSITDVFLIYFRRLGLSSWTNSVPDYRIFNSQQWSVINTSMENLKQIYSGAQTLNIDAISPGGSSDFYIIRTGYFK
jgi:hypothetical protein